MALFTGLMVLDILGILTALVAIGYTYIKWKLQYWQRRGVPVVEQKDLEPGVNIRSTRDGTRALYNYAKSRGWKYYASSALIKSGWVPIDLDLIKNVITKDFSHFMERGFLINEKVDPLSNNLFNLGGKKWRHMRMKITPAFTSGKLKAMFQTLVDCGLVMEEHIEKNTGKNEAVDIKELLRCFSTNIIGSCAFGLDCNTFQDPDSPFRFYAKKSLARSKWIDYGYMIAAVSHTLARLLRVRSTAADVTEFYFKVVEDTVKYRLENNIVRKDFLQLLIDMKSDRDEKDGLVEENKMSMKEIVAQCFLFFIAGFETSSTTMTFVLYELGRQPHIQDKVRQELNEVLAKYKGEICYDALNELKYMKQVIDETLRLYPAVPFLIRQCSEDYRVPGEDLVIEKGTTVTIPVIGLHYDEEYYEHPTVFNAERFSEENKKNIPQYAYMPFGEGPRICIGERFGIMQTKVGLACLLRRFKVTLDKKTQVPVKLSKSSFMPAAEGGIWLNLEQI